MTIDIASVLPVSYIALLLQPNAEGGTGEQLKMLKALRLLRLMKLLKLARGMRIFKKYEEQLGPLLGSVAFTCSVC